MREKLKICLVGCGAFAKFFVSLFKVHPDVESICVCDLIKSKAEAYSKEFKVPIMESFEKALADKNINTVAIFTQRYRHGSQVIAALEAGKHVYSAVPTGITVEEIAKIEELVRKTHLTYATGETGYYRACTVLCRDLYARGVFGDFVYGESQYNHDMRNMYGSYMRTEGESWRKYAGLPPTFYPTHSVSMILGAMPGTRIKKLSAMGYTEKKERDIFGTDGKNLWDNPFSNTAMLCELSNGGIARISENRRLCWQAPESYISQFYGSDSSYEFSVYHHYLSRWKRVEAKQEMSKKPMSLFDITDVMQPESVKSAMKVSEKDGLQGIADGLGFTDSSAVQPVWRLPQSFSGMINGHNGCHHFMVDDFCRAVATGRLTPTNIWQAARFNIPGLIAYESAKHGGVITDVPDLGDVPEGFELLKPDGEYGDNKVCTELIERLGFDEKGIK